VIHEKIVSIVPLRAGWAASLKRLPDFIFPFRRQSMLMLATHFFEGSIDRLSCHDATALHRPNQVLSHRRYIAHLAVPAIHLREP
jgi:hypothetical protein